MTKLVCCVVLLACLTWPATPVTAAGTTEVSGTIPVRVYDISVTAIAYYQATINFKTNGNATSQVFYDTVSREQIGDYRYSTTESPDLVTEHSLTLTGLRSGTRYYFRVRARIPDTEFVAISDQYTFTTRTLPLAPTPPTRPVPPVITVNITGLTATVPLRVDARGIVQASTRLITLDGKLWLDIAAGTRMLDARGKPLRSMSAACLPSPPAPPPEAVIILACDLGPDGATFEPPITLTMQYDPQALPTAHAEEDLYIAYRDGARWVVLETTVDTIANTASCKVSHFTIFALVSPAPVPAVRYRLTISSTAGGSVTQPGEGTFTYDAGTVVSLVATPDAGYRFVKWTGDVGTIGDVNAASTTITMNGNYTIRANFERIPPPTKWPLIGGIIAAVVAVALVIFFVRRRR